MPGDQVEEIKNKLDVKDVVEGYVRLQKSGANWRARCPFHNEKTPSFFVTPARQIWKCFGCGVGGDIFTFIEQIEGVEFSEALRLLARKAGVELRRQDPRLRSEKNKSLEICNLSAKYFHHQLESKNGQLVVKYLHDRGITEHSLVDFMVGYAPNNDKSLLNFLRQKGYSDTDMEHAGLALKSDRDGNYFCRFRGRIIFPIFNTNSDVVGFGARALSDELAQIMGRSNPHVIAKYINSPQSNIYDKSRILYGLDKAKIVIRQKDVCIIVEGYTDVIMAHQVGYKNVVASSGTALTNDQLNLISRFTKNLITSFDMDLAGDTATKRGIDLALNAGFNIKVIILDEGYDPADIIRENKQKWVKSVKGAVSFIQFYLDSSFAKYDSLTAEGKGAIGKITAPILASIPSRIEQAHWVSELATRLGVTQEDVWSDVKRANIKKISHAIIEKASIRPDRVAKSRKDLMLHQIFLHTLKDSKLIDVVRGGMRKEVEQLAVSNKGLADQLLFEAEIRGSEEFTENSLKLLITSYKKLVLDEDLKELERRIRANEQSLEKSARLVEDGESRRGRENKKLLEEFNAKVAEREKIN